jgi:serine O-acetyltransferase
VFDKVRADFARYEIHTLPGACWRTLGSTRLQAIVLMRFSTALHPRAPRVAGLVKNLNTAMTGCDISAAATIGPGIMVYHSVGIVIGPGVTVGERCTIAQHITLGSDYYSSPVVEHDVFIGPGAVIVGGFRVGSGARVGANAVVRSDIPRSQTWAASPRNG